MLIFLCEIVSFFLEALGFSLWLVIRPVGGGSLTHLNQSAFE